MAEPLTALLLATVSLLLLGVAFWPHTGLYARWRRAGRRSARVRIEDSLKHIFTCEMENRSPSLQSIAGALAIPANEAAGLIADLQAHRLITMEDQAFRLTPAGREYALRVVRAHRLWERYLSDETGYAQEDWHGLAEDQEHHLTPDEADALAASLGHPTHDPHGDPIPTASGELRAPDWHTLASLAPSQRGQIVHIEDEPAVIYSQLLAEELHTGMQVTMLESTPQRVHFSANGKEHVLAPLLANNISVQRIEEDQPQPPPGIPLSDLPLGQTARVLSIGPAIRGAARRRLMDLGLLPGAQITSELRSPAGDPAAYILRGALIALREEQARHIRVIVNGRDHDE